MKKVIVVLGMHRSGTSAITRGLELLGASLGKELMPAVAGDNDKGFWEDLGINDINERLLEKLNSSWDALASIDVTKLSAEVIAEERDDALRLLKLRMAYTDVFGFKDPRTVNLLPFWQSIFSELELDDKYLLAIRDPRSVADSLARRNSFNEQKSYYLWKKHLTNALKYLPKRPVVVVDYDQLLAAPLLQLKRIAETLYLSWPGDTSDAVSEYATEFLSADLRHSLYDKTGIQNHLMPASVEALYKSLLSVASNKENAPELTSIKWNQLLGERELESFLQYVDTVERALIKVKEEKLSLEEKKLSFEREIAQEVRFHQKLNEFTLSPLGRVFAIFEKTYLLLRARPGQKTAYSNILEESKDYLVQHNEWKMSEPVSQSSRLYLAMMVLKYLFRHPFSSLRLLNWQRFKKLVGTLFSSDKGGAVNWVAARFPEQGRARKLPIIFPVSQELDSKSLTFPKHTEIDVSIIIPVFNQYRTTISCLQSVLAHTKDINYEVIIADDLSTDLTSSIEKRVDNIVVVRGYKNVGFLRNCNRAVSVAKGKYIVLLNNDTNVQEAWLDSLLRTIERDPKVGMVGPKLLFDNGNLQEAGGIIWNDASGWNYGRGQDPELPEFNYLRETDYISGACIMLQRSLWDRLGGFDERFCPAYYEDTDLAFQVRQNGYKVVYQPESEVVHFEGVSNGTDLSSGIKKHQQINQEVFSEKWKTVLKQKHFLNGQNVFEARDRSSDKTTVVFIDQYVPFFDKDAGSRSTYMYVKQMVESGINVKFMPANFFPHEPYTGALQQLGVEVLVGEKYARNWKKWFKENANNIDVIYLHRPHITEDFIDYLLTLKPRPKLIYFGHDLHYLRTLREAELNNDQSLKLQADDWKRREYAIFRKVDKVFYPSNIEVMEIKSLSPETDVSALPLFLLEEPELNQYKHESRNDLLFVGGFGHPPNVDAVQWFIQAVMPHLLAKQPELKLNIVGSNVPDAIKNLVSEHVIVHGFLSDDALSELYKKVRVVVVPLRFGAGVKGKVLEALQAGVPIVTTSIGAEGIPDADKVMRISDIEHDMAQDILELYDNEGVASEYISRYPSYINHHFSRQAIQAVIDREFLK